MSYLPLSRNSLPQALADSFYPAEKIPQFLEAYDKGKTGELLAALAMHREEILNYIHERQENLDCIDYLIYQLKQQSA